MYLWVSTFRPMPGKEGQALAWAKAVAGLIDRSYSPAGPTRVLVERLGDHAKIYVLMDLNGSADLDRVYSQAGQDQELLAIGREFGEPELFVPGSRRDTLLLYK